MSYGELTLPPVWKGVNRQTGRCTEYVIKDGEETWTYKYEWEEGEE